MASELQSSVRTLTQVFSFMAAFAGGSVPSSNTSEYNDWLRWVQQAQEEYARRAFWRRCLTREEIDLTLGYTTLLPVRFHKPNGIYMLIVDEVDWLDPDNEDEQYVFVEMDNDPESDNYGRWQMRFKDEIEEATSAILWYFANPPTPVESADILLLPGDMIAYRALAEHFRAANQEGSQDKAEEDAENRFQEYLSLETIPSKNELLRFNSGITRVDQLIKAKNYYRTRTGRSYQR